MLDCTVRQVGKALGVVLSKEMLSHLNVQNGDTIFLPKSLDGKY
jgi:antitoxin component of MazEF toxin-antitoxin module